MNRVTIWSMAAFIAGVTALSAAGRYDQSTSQLHTASDPETRAAQPAGTSAHLELAPWPDAVGVDTTRTVRPTGPVGEVESVLLNPSTLTEDQGTESRIALVSAAPSRSFSPNGDGFEDSAKLALAFSGPVLVDAEVRTADGILVRSIHGDDAVAQDHVVVWDGRIDDGSVATPGHYDISIIATDVEGKTLTVAVATIVDLLEPASIAAPLPGTRLEGATGVVLNVSPGRQHDVSVLTPTGLVLSQTEPGLWQGILLPRMFGPDGPDSAVVAGELVAEATWLDGFGASHTYQTPPIALVGELDDRPVAVDDRYRTTDRRTLRVARPGFLANDLVPVGSLTLVEVGEPVAGRVLWQDDGSFRYVPQRGWAGTDSFAYVVENEKGQRSSAVVRIIVEAVDSRPTIEFGSRSRIIVAYSDRISPIRVTAKDLDGGLLSLTLSQAPEGVDVAMSPLVVRSTHRAQRVARSSPAGSPPNPGWHPSPWKRSITKETSRGRPSISE